MYICSRRYSIWPITYIVVLPLEPSYQVVWISFSRKPVFWNIVSQFFGISFVQCEKFLNILQKTVIYNNFLWTNLISCFYIGRTCFLLGRQERQKIGPLRHPQVIRDRTWHQSVWVITINSRVWTKERIDDNFQAYFEYQNFARCLLNVNVKLVVYVQKQQHCISMNVLRRTLKRS